MTRTVFIDIETDSLDATQIYCAVTLEGEKYIEWISGTTLQEYLDDATVVAHNGLSFDFPVLAKLWNVRLKMENMRDTLVLSMMDNPAREGGHSLKSWGERLGSAKIEFNDFSQYTGEMMEYCKQDVKLCSQVYNYLQHTLQEFSPKSVSDEHRMRIVADRISHNGFGDRLIKLGWVPQDLTPTGQPKVDEKTLAKCKIPVAETLATYFMLQKRSALVRSWVKACTDQGRVHCKYRTLGAITNRMSCVDPNLQQVPAVRVEYGKECRELFTAGKGNKLLDTDAAGLELRVLAHYMDDDKFTKEVLEGDVHTANQNMAGLDNRDQAKTFIYALLYGAGDAKIGAVVNGSAKDGAELRARFMANMPAYKRLSEAVIRKGESEGKLKALDGRVLRVRSGHASLNTLIQGSSAVLMKKWFMYVDHHLRRRKLQSKIVAMIHDELVLESCEKDVDASKECVILSISQVNKAYDLRCRLDCDVQVGDNWSEIH